MDCFTIVIAWRNGTHSTQENLTIQDVINWFVDLEAQASRDLVKQVLVVNESNTTLGDLVLSGMPRKR